MVIRAPYHGERAAQWISERTGLVVVTLPFTVGGTKEARDLFALFEDTIARLLAARR
jgi:zinc/manganese transport system substrate-binding protein